MTAHEGKAEINLAHGWKMLISVEKLVPQLSESSESKVSEFRAMIRAGSLGPPLLVYPLLDGRFQIRDGTNRYHALTEEGIDRVSCIVVGRS
jgi:ParB-like chromosome segregation protein Spo0J